MGTVQTKMLNGDIGIQMAKLGKHAKNCESIVLGGGNKLKVKRQIKGCVFLKGMTG